MHPSNLKKFAMSTRACFLSLVVAPIRFASPIMFFLLIAPLLASPAHALESDRDQSIEIESDSAEFRDLEGITVYSGNVRMSQGSILLLADQISIHTQDGDVNRLVATGNRAYYEQLPEAGQDKVVAQGKTIEYLLNEDVINLIQNASLTQEGATLNGNRITYDVRNHLLTANNAKTGNGDSSGERVRVVIPSLGSGL